MALRIIQTTSRSSNATPRCSAESGFAATPSLRSLIGFGN